MIKTYVIIHVFANKSKNNVTNIVHFLKLRDQQLVSLNTLKPRQDGHHLLRHLKCLFLNENV